MFGQLGSNRFVVKRGRGVRKNGGMSMVLTALLGTALDSYKKKKKNNYVLDTYLTI